MFGSFGYIGPSPAESALVIDFTRAAASVIYLANTPGSWVTPRRPLRRDSGVESGDVEAPYAYRLSVPVRWDVDVCLLSATDSSCRFFNRVAVNVASRIAAARAATSRPPASAVPPPRPERKVGARAIHAGPITPTTNRARTAQPRRHRPPHMPMCYMHATMHHAEHHAHLIYMRCEREGPCSVWPTRHDFGRVPVRVSATPCRDSVLGFMDVTSSHIPPRLLS